MTRNLTFPSYFADTVTKEIMDQLLNKTPGARIGTSFEEFKFHKFFKDIDWVINLFYYYYNYK